MAHINHSSFRVSVKKINILPLKYDFVTFIFTANLLYSYTYIENKSFSSSIIEKRTLKTRKINSKIEKHVLRRIHKFTWEKYPWVAYKAP